MPSGKKVLFREWKARLESIVREELGADVSYDEELAANFWREGHSARAFFREHVADPGEREDLSDLTELAYGD
jgi:hypothetical protein